MPPRKPAVTEVAQWQQVGALIGAILLAVAGGAVSVTTQANNQAAELGGRLDELRQRLTRIEARLDKIEERK